MLAASYPFLDVLWSMVIFFMFVIWLMILWKVIGDLFRRRDIDGGIKVVWFVFVILLPFLGVFVYLIAEGHKMADRDVEHAQAAKGAAGRAHQVGRRVVACRSDHPGEAVARQRRDHPGRVRHDEGEGARLGVPFGLGCAIHLAQPNPSRSEYPLDRAGSSIARLCSRPLLPDATGR